MAGLGDLFITVGADISGFKAAMGDVNDTLDSAVTNVEKATNGWAAAFSSLQTVGFGLSAAITAPLVGLGAAAVTMSEQINMARISFTTMLGSAQEAGAFLEKLKAFAAATPFEFPELVDAAKRMLAMGFAADQVIPTLRIIGDTVAGLGGGAQMIDRVTLALGQMQAKGKVSAQEMNQLAENGIPAWQMLADKIGMSIPEAMKKAEAGAISASVAIPAILDGMNQKFNGLMDTASKTLTGVWSNFKDAASYTLADIGKTLAPVLKDLVENVAMPLLNFAKDLAAKFATLDPWMQKAIIGFAALAAAVGPILLVVGTLGQAFIAAQTAIAVILPALEGIGVALAGISVPTVAAVAAIVAVGYALIELASWVSANWAPIVAVVSQAWEGISELWAAVWGAIVSGLQAVWAPIAAAASSVWGGIVAIVAAVWDPVQSAFGSVWGAIAGALMAVWDGIKSAAATVWEAIATAIRGFLDVAAKIPGVSKLMNLDEVWVSAKKAADALNESKKAAQDHAAAADDATASHKKLAPAITNTADAQKEAKKAAQDLAHAFTEVGLKTDEGKTKLQSMTDALKRIEAAWQSGRASTTAYVQAIANVNAEISKEKLSDLKKKLQDLTDQFNRGAISDEAYTQKKRELTAAIEQLAPKIVAVRSTAAELEAEMQKLSAVIFANSGAVQQNATAQQLWQATMNAWKADPAIQQVQKVEDAYKTLGMTAGAALEKQKEDAVAAYLAIANSGTATAQDIERAWKAMNEAIDRADAEATGKTKGHLDEKKGLFVDFGNQVSTIFTDFSRDVAKILFEGGGSIGDKFKDMLKSMGESVLRMFVEPAEKALGDLMTGVIKDLIGGKGFGGIVDTVKDVGHTITEIFTGARKEIEATTDAIDKAAGGGGSAAPGGGTPGGGGGGGGAPGGGAGGIGGIAGVVNLVSGVVTAISSVIQAFQLHGIGNDTGHIEVNTRETVAELQNLRADEWMREEHLFAKLDNVWQAVIDVTTNITGGTWERLDQMITAAREVIPSAFSEQVNRIMTGFDTELGALATIEASVGPITPAIDGGFAGLAASFNAVASAIKQSIDSRPNVSITVNGGDPNAGQQIVDKLRSLGLTK